MDLFIELLKSFFIGIVEGITEWLPISSTGHMILVDEFVRLDVSPEFLALFLVVIQIGAIMAVVILYFNKLNPFARAKSKAQRDGTWRLWGMVVIGCLPAAAFGFLLDDWVTEHFFNAWVVAMMLILYGVVFIVIERINRQREREALAMASRRRARAMRASRSRGMRSGRSADAADPYVGPGDDGDIAEDRLFRIRSVDDIDWRTALKIGFFQVLAIVPGTSRSGATIIGGMLCGCSRTAAAEFTFFLAIPVMLGWGLLKAVKYALDTTVAITGVEVGVLLVGLLTAFVVSIFAIKFLMSYIKRNDFTAFGVYRIVLGVCVIAFFLFTGATPQAA